MTQNWRTVLQPDGKLAVWSTTICHFILRDASPEFVVVMYAEEAKWEVARDIDRANKERLKSGLKPMEPAEISAKADELGKFLLGVVATVTRIAEGNLVEGDLTWEEAIKIRNFYRKEDNVTQKTQQLARRYTKIRIEIVSLPDAQKHRVLVNVNGRRLQHTVKTDFDAATWIAGLVQDSLRREKQ